MRELTMRSSEEVNLRSENGSAQALRQEHVQHDQGRAK